MRPVKTCEHRAYRATGPEQTGKATAHEEQRYLETAPVHLTVTALPSALVKYTHARTTQTADFTEDEKLGHLSIYLKSRD